MAIHDITDWEDLCKRMEEDGFGCIGGIISGGIVDYNMNGNTVGAYVIDHNMKDGSVQDYEGVKNNRFSAFIAKYLRSSGRNSPHFEEI